MEPQTAIAIWLGIALFMPAVLFILRWMVR